MWVAARQRPAAYDREAEEFAYVYALTHWGWTQDAAAQSVANFFSGKQVDLASTKKRSNKAKTVWTAEGPFRRMRQEHEPPEATEQHLRDGEDVIVELHAPGLRIASIRVISICNAVLAARDKYAD